MDKKSFIYRYWVLLIMLFLSACTHVSKPDGPPNFYVDVSKIPDAVPKPEKISKYGNYSTYHVFGKPYHVMRTSKNYVATGTASWYGTKFHNHSTSSGERYNMLAMTAAHRTLPLPTYVEVTNLKNHKKIIVKVNDRGPFVGNRLIDLSYAAAKKLGMTGHGTTRVQVRAIDPLQWGRSTMLASKTKQSKAATPVTDLASKVSFKHVQRVATKQAASGKAPAHGIYLQVGAFRNKSNADNLRKRLSILVKADIKVITALHPTKKLYRVEMGPFKDKTTASKMSKRIKASGLATRNIQQYWA